MQKNKLLFFVIVLGLISASACTSDLVSAPPLETEITEILAENPTETSTCDPLLTISGVAFPRQEPVDGPREVMEAELVGKLSIHEGCVRIESIYGENSYLPIWPPDFNLEIKDDVPVVFDGSGAMVGRMDEEIFIYMGGGEVPESFLPACIREQLPENCSGPIWIVGEGVRPVLRHDANLFNLETFATNDGSVFLVSQNIVLDDWIDQIATIEGMLVLPESTTIPRLQSDTLGLDVLLIWPQGYSIQFLDGFVEIINPIGDVIAREGEKVVLHGGPMPIPFTPEQNPELYYDLPDDCIGPFWIIRK